MRTFETIINLIGNTTKRGRLVVRARLDRRRYPTGKKVSKRDIRGRRKNGLLPAWLRRELEAIPGWSWEPRTYLKSVGARTPRGRRRAPSIPP